MKLTAIIEKSEDGWFLGQIEELPAALSQGKTIDELKENLIEAIRLLMETNVRRQAASSGLTPLTSL